VISLGKIGGAGEKESPAPPTVRRSARTTITHLENALVGLVTDPPGFRKLVRLEVAAQIAAIVSMCFAAFQTVMSWVRRK